MHVVVNRIRLDKPIDDEVFAAAQRDIPPRAARIEGLEAFHFVRVGQDEVVVVIVGDSEDAIEQMRADIGNDWMRENVIPHAAEPPERVVGAAVVSYVRS